MLYGPVCRDVVFVLSGLHEVVSDDPEITFKQLDLFLGEVGDLE